MQTLAQSRIFLAMVALIAAITLSLSMMPQSAFAYTKLGGRWASATQKICVTPTVTGAYKTQLKNAIANYTAFTDATMSASTSTSVPWKASVVNKSSVSWEGVTYTTKNSSNRYTYASSQLNKYFCDKYKDGVKKVVWLHELGHGWGLGHVSSVKRVMYTSASKAYSSGGVRALTTDEIAGINALY